MSQHTPTPWTVTNASSAYMEGTIIMGPDATHEVAGVWMKENAAYIVKAVNNHERLLEALKRLDDAINEPSCDDLVAASDHARDVIAQAETRPA